MKNGTEKNIKLVISAELLKTVLGLFIFAFGVYLTMCADIGLAPWDVLAIGISKHLPISYGIALSSIGIILLVVDIILGAKIGLGTLLDALLVGNFVDLFNNLGIITRKFNFTLSIGIFIVGLFIMAFGQYFYMSAGQGCGPRDSLLIALGKKVKKTPIGAVNIVILAVVLFSGWLLGGPVGLGTILGTFGTGITLQTVCRILRFEPRNVVHKDILKTLKILSKKVGN